MPARRPRPVDHLDTLRLRVHGLHGPFSCGGTYLPKRPVALRFGRRPPLEIARELGQSSPTAVAIVSACRPAGFGVGRRTRHDRRVRDGGHLLAKDKAFTVENLDLERGGLLRTIHEQLCPNDPHPPTAELYALNVYERGGRFVTHKDTPRAPDALGTLVVCLPVRFRGGSLVLRHGAVEELDWGSAIDRQREPRRLHWAAFFGDVDHEIEEVGDGTRVTLTWTLIRNGDGTALDRPPSAPEADLAAALQAALSDPAFMPRGGTLGLPCGHLYPEAPGLARPSSSLGRETARRLKGRDRELALAALGAGLDVRFRPYLFEADISERWRLSRMLTRQEASVFRDRQIDASTIEECLPIERHFDAWDGKDEDVTWIVPPPWQRDDGTATELLGQPEYSQTGYFGNEGSDAAFYVTASLLITIPPARDRTRATRSKRRR